MIDHESVHKAGKGAASLNDFVYCRVACEFTLDYISHHSSRSVNIYGGMKPSVMVTHAEHTAHTVKCVLCF